MKYSLTTHYHHTGDLNLLYQCLLDHNLLQLQTSHLLTNPNLVHQEEPLSRSGHRIPPLLLRGKNHTEEGKREALLKALIAQRKSFTYADQSENMKQRQMEVLTCVTQRGRQSSRTMKIFLSEDPDSKSSRTWLHHRTQKTTQIPLNPRRLI